jgi:hypothetical protein
VWSKYVEANLQGELREDQGGKTEASDVTTTTPNENKNYEGDSQTVEKPTSVFLGYKEQVLDELKSRRQHATRLDDRFDAHLQRMPRVVTFAEKKGRKYVAVQGRLLERQREGAGIASLVKRRKTKSTVRKAEQGRRTRHRKARG